MMRIFGALLVAIFFGGRGATGGLWLYWALLLEAAAHMVCERLWVSRLLLGLVKYQLCSVKLAFANVAVKLLDEGLHAWCWGCSWVYCLERNRAVFLSGSLMACPGNALPRLFYLWGLSISSFRG